MSQRTARQLFAVSVFRLFLLPVRVFFGADDKMRPGAFRRNRAVFQVYRTAGLDYFTSFIRDRRGDDNRLVNRNEMLQLGIQSGRHAIQSFHVHCLAQHFVEDTGGNPAVQIAGPALILLPRRKHGSDRFAVSLKFQLQTDWIIRSAAETAVVIVIGIQ